MNEIFMELARMIREQGEIVESIEKNIERAAINVEGGGRELEKAKVSQSAARRKKIWLILILIIALVLLGLIIYCSVK